MRHLTVLSIAVALCLVACSSERKSQSQSEESEEGGGGGQETVAGEGSGYNPDSVPNPNRRDPSTAGGGGASNGTGGGNVGRITSWDQSNNYPTGLENAELKGSPVPSASDAGSNRQPPNNWTAGGSGAGHFILAGSSTQLAQGDVLRRLSVDGGTVTEHDFNPALDGVQGLALIVPDKLRGGWDRIDFSGDGLFAGTLCGLIPGPDKKLIAFAGRGAFIIDPYAEGEGGAVEPEATILFPRSQRVCDGVYSPQHQKVYGVEVQSIDAHGTKGVWVASVPPEGVVSTAGVFRVSGNYGIVRTSRNTFQDADVYGNVLYLVEGGGRIPGGDDVVIHRVPLNDQGEPLFDNATQVATGNPLMRASGCAIGSPDNTAAVLAVEVGGSPVLLVGGTQGVTAWDISGDELQKLDMDPRAGLQPLDLSQGYGRGAPEIHLSPDGEDVFVMPFCHSEGKVKVEHKDTTEGLSTFDAFYRRLARIDIADGELNNGIEAVDVGYHWFQQQLADTIENLRMPNFKMDFRDMAVGPEHIVVIGYGGRNNSGLGPGGDVIVADRSTNKVLTFAEPGANPQQQTYGFRLAKDDPDIAGDSQSVWAAVWVP